MHMQRFLKWRWLFVCTVLFILVRWFLYQLVLQEDGRMPAVPATTITTAPAGLHDLAVQHFLEQREKWKTSNLGALLFKGVATKKELDNKTYQVLIWKGTWLKRRHVFNYGNAQLNPLKFCSVKNCNFSFSDKDLTTADAVIFHMFNKAVPTQKQLEGRQSHQRYVFLTDESPLNTFQGISKSWNRPDFFNWSMSYRTDSDVPVPYGRVVPLPKTVPDEMYTREGLTTLIPNWKIKKKDVLAAILISFCTKKRMDFIEKLQKYMRVDVLGKCSKDNKLKDACPGHYGNDCPAINNYYFYIAFENSRCFQYITEKVFYNSFGKGAIPVIAGTDHESATQLLPPHSFIFGDDYKNLSDLAKLLKTLANNEEYLLSYHTWRRHFAVINEHGYFKTRSVHLCRTCEALNYNSKQRKIYNTNMLDTFLKPQKLCYS